MMHCSGCQETPFHIGKIYSFRVRVCTHKCGSRLGYSEEVSGTSVPGSTFIVPPERPV